MDNRELLRQLDIEGYTVLPHVLTEEAAAHLTQEITTELEQASSVGSVGSHSTRNLLHSVSAVRILAASAILRALVEPVLGRECCAVRGILFNKVEGANWKVPWHQDVSVALRAQQDVAEYGPWSEKAGVVHAQAPVTLLERMLTVRLHLDDCDATNGPLRVLPATHRMGKLSAERMQTLRSERKERVCVVPRGGVVLMRPLLLHASSPAQMARQRRVVHLEYAGDALPAELEWHTRIFRSL